MFTSTSMWGWRFKRESAYPAGTGWIQVDVDFATYGKVYFNDTGDLLRAQWNHVVLNYDGTALRMYINGSKVAENTSAPGDALDTNNTFEIMSDAYGDGNYLDEFRYSRASRSQCWIETEFNNQNAPTTFYSISTEQGQATTAVDLLTFTATGEGEDVKIYWETADETDNLGFHLYRSTSAQGEFNRLSDRVIPAATYMTGSPYYTYMDTGVTRGKLYYYKLEDIDIHGNRTLHGPICVDWDGDGMPDDWELAHGLDPTVNDADLDPDAAIRTTPTATATESWMAKRLGGWNAWKPVVRKY
jgi:hypothetical protein